MKAYKGTDKNLCCKGLQYAVDKETIHDGNVEPCKSGLHACENPLDVLAYYPAFDGARYFEVECDGEIKRHNEDSKIACSKITVKTEIGLLGLINAGIEMIFDRVKKIKLEQDASGDWGTSVSSGDWGTSVSSGDQGTSVSSGNRGTSVSSGDWGTSVSSGDQGTAIATGKESLAVANGYQARAKGAKGCYLTITEYDDNYNLLCVKTRKVDGKHIKADTLYMLVDGKFVVAE